MNTKIKSVIGRVEKLTFPDLNREVLYARIDTGAKTSSIWASEMSEKDDHLIVRFAAAPHPIANHVIIFDDYSKVKVASSMGHEQTRYKVKLPVIIRGRKIIATFTLADRSSQVYPVLVGRNTLMKKFIVDVAKGTPLIEEERRRSEILQSGLEE